ncbi:WhiB family transcriptional regulator [Streptomyces somaliensis]|uniref:WhiB family transcriptional regulator n=1 Tax=Streptomyces somaliensis TaxID=78355 RepID=UPI0034E94008|nr:WhiB family transcriptional regulator [Streptomyces somaliensis]MCP9975989.1 WhiB family transcriptional regulator [Streptomyces somaliensis]
MSPMPTYSIEDRTTPRSAPRSARDDAAASWRETALCAQTGPELFFPEPGSSTREAKFLCGMCEIREACLEYALAHDERFGVWGGLSEQERYALKRRAGRR